MDTKIKILLAEDDENLGLLLKEYLIADRVLLPGYVTAVWNWMKRADVDLSVDIQSFDRENSEALSANFSMVLQSGHLSINPAVLVYPKGRADLSLQFYEIQFQRGGRES